MYITIHKEVHCGCTFVVIADDKGPQKFFMNKATYRPKKLLHYRKSSTTLQTTDTVPGTP